MKRYIFNFFVSFIINGVRDPALFFFAAKAMLRALLVAAAAAVCFAELTSSRACIPRDLVSRLRGGGSRDRAEIMADLEVLRRQRDAGEVSQDDFRRRKDALKQVRAAARPHPGPCLRTHLRRDRAWHPRCDTRFCRAPALSLPALTRPGCSPADPVVGPCGWRRRRNARRQSGRRLSCAPPLRTAMIAKGAARLHCRAAARRWEHALLTVV